MTTLVVLAGALLAWFAYGRTWQLEPPCTTSFVPRCGQPTSGAELEPAGAALALIAALTSLAVVPTRERGRRIVGVLVLLMGLTGLAVSVAARSLSPSSWWVVATIGSILIVVGSVVTIRRSPGWPTMSSRYERGAAENVDARVDARVDPGSNVGATPGVVSASIEELGVKEAWDALERGVDPTLDPAADLESAQRTDSERRTDPGGLAETGLSE